MTNQEYPFYTETIDGTEKVGICFLPSSAVFCEFQNPDSHNEWAQFTCPRTGKTVTYDGPLNDALKSCMGGHIRATIPAEKWAQFRETYLCASDMDTETAREKMKEIAPDPPAKTGIKG